MRLNYIILYLFVIIASISCTKNTQSKLEIQIKQFLEDNFVKDTFYFKLTEVTDFKWDKFFVFKSTAQIDEIEEVIGTQYDYYNDIAERYIFLDRNNQIVYHEDHFPNYDGIVSDEIVFNLVYTSNYRLFNKNDNFYATKVTIGQGEYYLIDQFEPGKSGNNQEKPSIKKAVEEGTSNLITAFPTK